VIKMPGFDFDAAMRLRPEKEKTNIRRYVLLLVVFVVAAIGISYFYENGFPSTSNGANEINNVPGNEIGSDSKAIDIYSIINPPQDNGQSTQGVRENIPSTPGGNPFEQGFDVGMSGTTNAGMGNEIPDMT
jgi:hypothetical protein